MTNTFDPLIITVAPNGARRTRDDHPALPMTPDQLAEDALACFNAGAVMIHLHAREDNGRHSLDPDRCRAAMKAVRAATDGRMMVQMTSEAAGIYQREDQMAAVSAVMPDAVSLAIREIVPDAQAEPDAQRFIATLRDNGVRMQFIIYSADELVRVAVLRDLGVLPPGRLDILFVLGKYAGVLADTKDLTAFRSVMTDTGLEEHLRWAVCAFGQREHACVMAAAALGGHVRVGFENNLTLIDGTVAPNNAALVAQVADGARLMGRPLAGIEDL